MKIACLIIGCAFYGAAFAACGGDSSMMEDAAPPMEAGHTTFDVDVAPDVTDEPAPPKPDAGYPGPHSPAPQVVNYGGLVLATPTIIPIFFPSDPDQTTIETFLAQTAASTFWPAATSEYGVGALTIGTSIVVTDTPPAMTNTSTILGWLSAYLDGTHSEFPAIAPNNVYVIFYPSVTTITESGFGTSCINYGGYHDEGKVAAQKFVYAVLPRCSTFGYLSGLDALTGPLSHEMIEAATDPLPETDPAWELADLDHMVWNLQPLGEIGDMCAYEPQSFQRLVGSYMVQRPWSNKAAAAGHDPCAPPLSTAYYNAAPVLTDTIALDYYGQQVNTKGVQVKLGASKTIPVQLFSDGPISDWTVQAVDSTYGTMQPQQLDFSWDHQTGNNGDTFNMTITRIANGPYQGSEFFIYAQHGSSTWNMWFGFVGN